MSTVQRLRSNTRVGRMAYWKERLSHAAVVLLMMTWVSGASALTKEEPCSIIKGPDGITYKLIHPHLPKGKRIDWEAEDGTSLARGDSIFPEKVVSVTNDSITLRECSDSLRAKWVNSGIRDGSTCRANCSAVRKLGLPQPMVNSTQLCLFKNVCGWKGYLLITVFTITPFVGFSAAIIWLYRRRCAAQATSYTPANKEIELEAVQSDQQN